MNANLRNKATWLAGVLMLSVILATQAAEANRVRLKVATSSPMMIAGKNGRAFLKVGLTGFPLERAERRSPVNVAIVLDRSGSMSGEKMWKAKEAAKMAIDRLGPDDIVSVVAYNHSVDILVPATKVTDRGWIHNQIDALNADGNTALFAGVSKGAAEVRKFLSDNRIGRVILVSDGLANVGPSSSGELADLGFSLIKEGISVSTIGLGTGYNEDLMAALARASDGNHAFAENAGDLARIFNHEFGDLLSVVAREVVIELQCGPGIRPIRVLGRDADIHGSKVVTRLNQLYAEQEKYLLVEMEIPASAEGASREVASVSVRYSNAVTQKRDVISGRAEVSFTNSQAVVDRSMDRSVNIASIELLSNETNRQALELRDKGKTKAAKSMLRKNAAFLEKKARKYKSKKLEKLSKDNLGDEKNLEGKSWNKQRKTMRKRQHELDVQQMW
ncbi:MAG: VWA domain-containing protein [Proteobacteria bacterium]|nr:VWA domain-containing protein [Pseudomonadota bacterium]